MSRAKVFDEDLRGGKHSIVRTTDMSPDEAVIATTVCLSGLFTRHRKLRLTPFR